VREVARELALTNVRAEQIRAEDLSAEYDFIVSRAVTRLKEFHHWVRGKASPASTHALRNGILYLKGGDLDEEIAELNKAVQVFNLADYFQEAFFETKKVVLVPL
jgi:16S rRNA (guanine527-N7)-methyltransferase